MRMAGPTDPNFEAHCRDIRDTAQHMADLVTDLLDIGKIEAGLDAAREPMDVVAVVGEALRLVGPNAERKAIQLRADLPAEAIVMAATIRIRQALVNLIDNGIKYTPSGGRVTVSAAFSAGTDGTQTVTIRISDTGLGIPARDLPHVFDKFYRVQSRATREIAGTGLGLAITKTIVESVGSASRASTAPGRPSPSRSRWLSPGRTRRRFRSTLARRSARRRTARARPVARPR
jgi:signal transduction histidine kinase